MARSSSPITATRTYWGSGSGESGTDGVVTEAIIHTAAELRLAAYTVWQSRPGEQLSPI